MHTKPSVALLKAVRAGFVAQGGSLARFCNQNGLTRQNVSKALTGEWRGEKATQIVHKVVAASLLPQG